MLSDPAWSIGNKEGPTLNAFRYMIIRRYFIVIIINRYYCYVVIIFVES